MIKGRHLSEEHKRKIGLTNSKALLGKKQSLETIEKRRKKLIGQKRTEEQKLRMSLAQDPELKRRIALEKGYGKWLIGRKLSEETKQKMREAHEGEKSYLWRGDDVGYLGIHAWVKKVLGQPDTCAHCGKSGLKGYHIHWANVSGEYKRDKTDWIRLCVSCHWKFDKTYEQRSRNPLGQFI